MAGALGRDLSPELVEEICAEGLPEVPLGSAIGMAYDDGPVVVFALVHGDEASAEANAEAIERIVAEGHSAQTRQPWSEAFTVDGVTADGTVTVARLRPTEGTSIDIGYDVFLSRDTLVSGC